MLYELVGQYLDIYNMDIDEETKLDTIEALGLDEEIESKEIWKPKIQLIKLKKNDLKRNAIAIVKKLNG